MIIRILQLMEGARENFPHLRPCLLRLFISRGLLWPPIKPPSWAPPRGARGRISAEIERQEREGRRLCRLKPSPLLSVAATATPPSSTPPPVAQRAPAARLWVAIAAQAGSGDGVIARRRQEQRWCRSPGEDGTANGGAALCRREGRRRRITARARTAPAAHRDFRVNICSSRFQCGFMKLFEGFCC